MIFVTGGTGLLGMRIVYDLLVRGGSLRLLRRPNSDMDTFRSVLDFYAAGNASHLIEKIEWVEGDLFDTGILQESLRGCNQCIHAAATVSFHPRDEAGMRRVNVIGTANLVNACLQQKDIKLLYISSVAALGRDDDKGHIDEGHSWKDSPYNTGYAISKYLAEMEVWRGIEEGLNAVMVNPSIIMGAGTVIRSSGTIFGVVAKGLRFYTDGGAALVDARDVSEISLKLLFSDTQSQRFVLSAGTIPYRELFGVIADHLGKKRANIRVSRTVMSVVARLFWLKDTVFRTKSPVTMETVRSSTSSYVYESAKVRAELGVEFRDIDDTLEYYSGFYKTS